MKNRLVSRRWIACAWMVLMLASIRAGEREGPDPSRDQRKLDIESFEYVWTTIRDKHFDPTFGGNDWQSVHGEFRPKIEKAGSKDETRQILQDMMSLLHFSHFNIIPSEVYHLLNRPDGSGSWDGTTGMDVRVIHGEALVTRVEAASPASLAGVRPGWKIVRIRDCWMDSVLVPVTQEFKDSNRSAAMLALAVLDRLAGAVGDSVDIRFLDGNDRPVLRRFHLARTRGEKYRLGHLPPFSVWIEVDTLKYTIGYIAFNAFLNPVRIMPAYNQAMMSFMNAKGIIIDLRGNAGGMGDMVMGMAGWLVSARNQHLGTSRTRDAELRFVIFPRPATYAGPVAVLVDGLSVCGAEIFAQGLRDLGRARLFGTRTYGAAMASAIEKLPNGDGFLYAFANYTSRNGDVLEKNGLRPDVEVPITRKALLKGKDPVVEAAVRWIRDHAFGTARFTADRKAP